MKLSTDRILTAAAHMVGKLHKKYPATHLDIGAGHGDLINILRSKYQLNSVACDYTDTLMKLPDVKVHIANLNTEPLPFQDSTFDLVTCTEVLEHLEHYRETLREAYRVLKPGGTFVLSTPNILNLKSRIRFLFFGFYNLFGPLHFRESKLHTTGGHINPIGLFFLSHSLIDAGFNEINLAIDKKQSSSWFWLALFYFPIKFYSRMAKNKEIKKYRTIDKHNIHFVDLMNRVDVCKRPGIPS